MAGKNLIHDDIFDAALNLIISTTDKIQVRKTSGGVLVSTSANSNSITLDASNWATVGAGSPSGRDITAAVSKSSDLASLAVGAAGAATHVALVDSAQVQVQANITSEPISIGASDLVNIGSFTITLLDPTA